ncbi:hypothetical protein [Winogradskyella sp.]|uniref:hypothetical protein n=1 Tax=Winogradskyella sp. TaxID=1883156 RepID=UPI003BAA1FAF
MKKIFKLLCFLLIVVIYSCDDILEEDITGDTVQIASPAEGQVVVGNTVQFLWQNLDGADNYRVQVLDQNQTLALDSLVSQNLLEYNLNEGSYQWRVKGENFAYETEFTFPVNFTVEVSDDLTNQSVLLSTPSDELYTNDTNITFTWNTLSSVDSYTSEVVKSNNGETTIYQEAGITTTSFNIDAALFDVDAEYIWKVKGVNTTSETTFSERSLFIDRVAPNIPTLNTPDDNITSTTEVTFNWTNGTDTGNIQSTVTNTIEIASDINFSSLLFSDDTQNNTYQYTFSNTGVYYWRVRAYDQAGNQSDNSITRTLTIE